MTSGIGPAMMPFRALLGSTSLAAAGSGGAIIDCVAISGVAGEALATSSFAGSAFPLSDLAISVFAASPLAASDFAMSVLAASVFKESLATDETVVGPGSAALAAGLSATGPIWVVPTGATAGAGGPSAAWRFGRGGR